MNRLYGRRTYIPIMLVTTTILTKTICNLYPILPCSSGWWTAAVPVPEHSQTWFWVTLYKIPVSTKYLGDGDKATWLTSSWVCKVHAPNQFFVWLPSCHLRDDQQYQGSPYLAIWRPFLCFGYPLVHIEYSRDAQLDAVQVTADDGP